MKKVRIGEIARHRKGSIVIHDDIEYKLCRVQLHRRGVVLREIRRGSEIKTKKQQICRNGDLVVAEMDAKFGGYGFIGEDLDGAIVSSHYYLFELDIQKINWQYFQVLIHSGIIQNQIEAKGSTNYSSIRAWEFLDYIIPLPDLETQTVIANRFQFCHNTKLSLHLQSDKQASLIKKLRQTIFQEAIEGKLTVEWRKKNFNLTNGKNHASSLLEIIKGEKDLIKNSKMCKEQPLPPINDDEKSFVLPHGWAWCRLGEVTNYGQTEKCRNIKNDTWVLDLEDIEKETSQLLQKVCYKDRNSLSDKNIFYKDYVLYGKLRPYLDKVIVADEDGVATTELVPIRTFNGLSPQYLKLILKSNFFIKYAMSKVSGMKMPRLGTKDAQMAVIPLAPLAEQSAIVEKVNNLLPRIIELEKKLLDCKKTSEMLMQSVLREAFA